MVDKLGFGGFEEGHLPNGIENVNYYFEDGTYLETLTAWDVQRAAWLAKFTSDREGPVFFALATSSLDDTTAFLARHGIHTGPQIPGSISTAHDDPGTTPKELWRTMFVDSGTLPGDPLFFIGYAQPQRSTHLARLEEARRSGHIRHHPNGAIGIKSVWLAVKDLNGAADKFAAFGLPAGEAFPVPALGAMARNIKAGHGSIVLLAPAGEGAINAHLQDRGPSLCGVSIQVARLGSAQKLIVSRGGKPAPEVAGPSGPHSILIEPGIAHGAWIELFEK
jgi:hypothetical protein